MPYFHVPRGYAGLLKPPRGGRLIPGHPLARNLEYLAPFWDGHGIYLQDIGPNNIIGTLTNFPASPWIATEMGMGLSFATDDWVNLGDVLNLPLPITWDVWIRLSSGGMDSWRGLCATDTIVEAFYYGSWITVKNTNKIIVYFADGLGNGSGNLRSKEYASALSANTIYHIVAVIRGANDISLYLNGEDDGGDYGGSGGDIAHSTASARIGSNSSEYFAGDIMKMGVYSRAFQPSEVQQLRHSPWGMIEEPLNRSIFYIPSGVVANPAWYYRQRRVI